MKKFGNILWGIVLIGVGFILGLNATGVTNINIFFDGWWTLFIIIPCFIGLFRENEKTGNIIGLLIGTALLLCCHNILDFDMIWKLALPVILVIIGLSIIFKDTFNHKISEEIKKLNEKSKGENGYCATFSAQNVNYDDQEFKGTTLTAVFGGVKCDLRKAIINENQVINCSATFGGIDIYVPSDVKVKIKSSSIFGGVSDDRKNKQEEENSKIIYINATCVFGGVEVK